MTDGYIELHAASAFSFLEGASQPEDLIERAAELQMPAIALLDRNGIYGAARFHTAAVRAGVAAHIGAEIAVADFGPRMMPAAWLPMQRISEPSRLPLLCTFRTGYQNLCQLITTFKLREPNKGEGAATLDDLEQYAEGLVCLTGGDEGPLAAALMGGGEEAGRRLVDQLIAIYGHENVYIELQRHHEREEEWRNQPHYALRDHCAYPCWQPMACATPRPTTARSSTSSLQLAITPSWIVPDACLR